MSHCVQWTLILVLISSAAGSAVAGEDEFGQSAFAYRNGSGSRLMLKRYGGSKATANGVDMGIRWLAYPQETDGHWDAKKFGAAQKSDTAVTSLALLAFLGPGHSEKVGEYKDNVKRAVAWLKSKQAADGMIFDVTDGGADRAKGANRGTLPASAVAALAMAEAAAMANIPQTRDAAQKAIDQFVSIQRVDGFAKSGWGSEPDAEANTVVTGWLVQVLNSAHVAELKIDHAAFNGVVVYLDSVQHDTTYAYSMRDARAQDSHRLTAIGCLSRQFLGFKMDELQPSVDGFVAKGGLPAWGEKGESVDLNFWYFATLCTFQQGGESWLRWNEALKTALLWNQRKDGDDMGSWDPVGANATEWGRVGEAALATLCLEVYYRYRPLNARRLAE